MLPAPHHPHEEDFMARCTRAFAVAILSATVVGACAETATSPVATTMTGALPTMAAVKFWDANAAANWNARATLLTTRRSLNAVRMYTYLSLAQLRAAEAAQAILPHPPTSSAIGAASVGVLNALFPLDATENEMLLDAQQAAEPWPGAKHEDWAAGEAIGRAAAARVMAYAAGDLIGLTDPGSPPVGPGYWVLLPGQVPVRGHLGARPFFLASRDEFRPPPPPTITSAAFLAALAEVYTVSSTRTDEQIAIAKYWAANQSPTSDAAMNNLAVDLIRTYRKNDLESARILFVMNAAAFDALIGCWDAKYHYWFIRPHQADPRIVPPTPLTVPLHPSYPSGHSCISGSSTGVLMAAFPSERERLEAVAQEASLSRLYAGFHYRFDMIAGIALGRGVAAKAWAADLDGVAVR
jgi:membrane-associated phospholipid phosphatase